MIEKFTSTSKERRAREEAFYELALQEVISGNIRPGLWAKAMATSNGSDEAVRGQYLKLRVLSMLDEFSTQEALHKKKLKIDRVNRELKSKEEEIQRKDELRRLKEEKKRKEASEWLANREKKRQENKSRRKEMKKEQLTFAIVMMLLGAIFLLAPFLANF